MAKNPIVLADEPAEFNANQYNTQAKQYVPRTQKVAVTELAEFFPEGTPVEKMFFVVRGLEGLEYFKANQFVDSTQDDDPTIKKINTLLEVGGKRPEIMGRRIQYVMVGTVKPKIDRTLANTIFEKHPMVGMLLSDTIITLMGLGGTQKESNASGENQKSEAT